MKTGRPFISLNLAMTADGKIATANGTVSSFGTPRDQARLYHLRSDADAIVCGANTVNFHPVDLGPGPGHFRRRRLRHGLREYPARVIVSGTGSLKPESHLFSRRFSPIYVLTTDRITAGRRGALERVATEVRVFGSGELDVGRALAWLLELGIRRLHCEGGGALNDALFRAGAVDRVYVTVCPFLFGGRDAPTIADGMGWPTLGRADRLTLRKRRQVGSEMFLEYDVLRDPRAAIRDSAGAPRV